MSSKTNKRIGLYSGTFDPVHAGHIGFALQAMEAGHLDALYFLPERRPRGKHGVEHFGHRVAMLQRALRPYHRMHVLELDDVSFSVERTWPRLKKRFGPHAELVLLVGSDVVASLGQWDNVEQLLVESELLIGLRATDSLQVIESSLAQLPVPPRATTIIESFAAEVSSGKVREALRSRRHVPGLLRSVERYSNRNWLYVSVA